MAGMKTSEVEVWEQLKDITECCVCGETYKDPKILPCIHTFCRTCLEETGCKSSKNPGDQMPCPMCRKEFTIPKEGYEALQKNFFMEKLIEMAKIASPPESSDLCEACMKGESESTSALEVPLAGMYCADCQKKLCWECSRYHTKNKLTRNHEVVDFIRKVQVVAPSICMKHKRELDLYCSDCKKLLCKACFGESHQNHRLQDMRKVVEGFKNEIKDILSALQVYMFKRLEKDEILNCEVEEYCKNLDILKLEVCAQTDAAIKLVSERVMLDQLKAQKREEVKAEMEDNDGYWTYLESFKYYCAEVMTNGSASEICSAINELKERFERIKDTEVKTSFRKISFQMSNLEEFVKKADFNIIGTLQECQTEVEGEDETKISDVGDKKVEDDHNNGIPAKFNHLELELEKERRRLCGLEMEKKALEKRINELELELGRLHGHLVNKYVHVEAIDYKRSPNLVMALQSDNGNIFGLTVLDDELFLGRFIDCIRCSVIEAYDIRTFSFKRRWQVGHLAQSNTGVSLISCMASCARYKCLYACGSVFSCFAECVPVIQRTDVNGSNAREWKIYGGFSVSNLSVTVEGNVIVITVGNSLIEYSRDGVLVHEMKLAPSLGIKYLWHALKLASGNFVVSHGFGKGCLHRVLILSKSGQIMKSFGEMQLPRVCYSQVKQVSQVYEPRLLYEPVYLTVDTSGNILVADSGNNRIVVLNSDLKLENSIHTTEPLQMPRCMYIDNDRRQLFVCEGVKKISVFDFSF